MENAEKLATLGTQDTGRRQAKQNTQYKNLKDEQHGPHQNPGMSPWRTRQHGPHQNPGMSPWRTRRESSYFLL